jgi:hypothetical protein
VFGDGFLAARAARELGCRNKLCRRGHGGVLV